MVHRTLKVQGRKDKKKMKSRKARRLLRGVSGVARRFGRPGRIFGGGEAQET
jgi:hypothetical protein